MSVRTTIFGLASAAIFASMAYGQTAITLNCGTSQTVLASNPGLASISPTNPIELRAEGTTELVSDVVIPCNAATGTTTGIQGNVTSYLQTTGGNLFGVTSRAGEATLAIIDPTAAHTTAYYSGVSAPNSTTISWGTPTAPVLFPSTYNFVIQISNVRVNVSNSNPTGQPPVVTEGVFAGALGIAALFQIAPLNVGVIRDGISVSGATGSSCNGATVCTGTLTALAPVTYLVCQTGSSQTQSGFSIVVSELFAGAFKSQNVSQNIPQGVLFPASANIPGAEAGSLYNGSLNGPADRVAASGLGSAVGTANSGTRIKFAFANIPNNVSLTVPLTISTQTLFLTLQSQSAAETAALSPATSGALTISGASATTTGTATAIYEVGIANLTYIKQFTLGVTVGFAANTVAVPQQAGPITITTSYSPSPNPVGTAVPTSTLPPTIPYFVNNGSPFNGATFTACQTTLLFPFITNEAGFETGIAIANTAQDNLAAPGSKNPSVASGSPGACTIFFYGSTGAEGGPQPATPTAPNFPAASKSPAAIAVGTTHADTLTDVIGGTFQGYAIAVCPFLYARGFAFIEYGLATTSGVVEGYTADIISANRLSSITGQSTVSNNFPESSGQ